MKNKMCFFAAGFLLFFVVAAAFFLYSEIDDKSNVEYTGVFFDNNYFNYAWGKSNIGCRITEDGYMEQYNLYDDVEGLKKVKITDEEMNRLKELATKVDPVIVETMNTVAEDGGTQVSFVWDYERKEYIELGTSMSSYSYNPTAYEFLDYVNKLSRKYIGESGRYSCESSYYVDFQYKELFQLKLIKAGETTSAGGLVINRYGEMLEFCKNCKMEDIKMRIIDNNTLTTFLTEVEKLSPSASSSIKIEPLDYDVYVFVYYRDGSSYIRGIIPVGETLLLSKDEKQVIDFFKEQYNQLIPDGKHKDFFDNVKLRE